MSIPSTGLGDDEELVIVVSPKRAMELLDCGQTRLYELLASGELESFKDGSSRKITLRSILRRTRRLLAAAAPPAAAPQELLTGF